jgi:hypothetical protein
VTGLRAWKKGAAIGALVSTILILWFLLFFLPDSRDKYSWDNHAGFANILAFIALIYGVTVFSIIASLIGYSFDNKKVRFRVYSLVIGIIFIMMASRGLFFHPYGPYVSETQATLFIFVPVILLYLIGQFMDKRRLQN